MNSPTRHPKSGIYYYRKVVPEALRAQVGKREVKISLGTREEKLARTLFLSVAKQVDEDWLRLQAAPILRETVYETVMSEKEVAALAGEMYREVITLHGDNPGRASVWTGKLVALQAALPDVPGKKRLGSGQWGFGPIHMAGRIVGADVGEFLDRRGIVPDWNSRNRLYYAAAIALAAAYRELAKRANLDYSDDPQLKRFPEYVPPDEKVKLFPDWQALYEGYKAAVKPSPSTIKRQLGVLTAFFAWLGHDDFRRIRQEDAQAWCDHRLGIVSSATVRDADVAHPKTVLYWAKRRHLIPANPFVDVKVEVKAVSRRDKEYTFDEAERVLSATLVPAGGKMTAGGKAARRWVPWLCAYSGARVTEMTQLRKEDIKLVRVPKAPSVWVMVITPEAGTQKSRKARKVALHPYLVEQGFLEFVASCGDGPLFYDPSRGSGKDAARRQSAKAGERLAAWVRKDVGITDPDVAPNHAWRHLFRSQMLAAFVQEQVINNIDGHEAKDVAGTYGMAWPQVMLYALSLIPRLLDEDPRMIEILARRASKPVIGTQMPVPPTGGWMPVASGKGAFLESDVRE